MPIQIEIQEHPTDDDEACIFCNGNTAYWNVESNRPICPQDSVKFEQGDIEKAPFNY